MDSSLGRNMPLLIKPFCLHHIVSPPRAAARPQTPLRSTTTHVHVLGVDINSLLINIFKQCDAMRRGTDTKLCS